ncbi:GDSL-type esterase/lipase family protein [Citricoccus sp. SGAir0253]|uniref:GDSL-type esterase/lipase family protein n=1 Tax=Citricoccus sp. SGAir0253 TaxID=2567881 RepID=UPI00143CC649|nr:GDSL-type esterase/lipase family protein [Citricoccus sp. SGAir0253]
MIRTVVRSAAALAASVAVAGAALTPATAAQPSYDVVNLGDSFSAGIGAGYPAPAEDVPGCYQGTGTSAAEKLGSTGRLDLLLDASCSGATTTQIAAIAQYPTVDAALDEAELVTLTLGGNDVGWTQVLLACSTLGDPALCDALLAQVPARIAAAAASAGETIRLIDANTDGTIVVLGYPHLFDGGADTAFLSAERIAQLNAATDALNAALRAAAEANGAIFVDVTDRFAGHGADSTDPWIYFNPANLQDPNNLHPNQLGYLYGYYPALRSALSQGQLAR